MSIYIYIYICMYVCTLRPRPLATRTLCPAVRQRAAPPPRWISPPRTLPRQRQRRRHRQRPEGRAAGLRRTAYKKHGTTFWGGNRPLRGVNVNGEGTDTGLGIGRTGLAFTRYCFTLELYCGSLSSFYCLPHLQSLPYCGG